MSAPERIRELVATFDYNIESYKKGSYNETQVRREFIDPFFVEFGWDIMNRQGYAEAYKDVIHEDAKSRESKSPNVALKTKKEGLRNLCDVPSK